MSHPTQLLFLPGAGGSPEFWKPVAELLVHPAARKRLGWPGFGPTPADPLVNGIDDLVNQVLDAIDQPTALIAQSMGGIVAVQAALRRPDLVTHLVLAVTSGGVEVSDLRAQDWRPAFLAANPLTPRWFVDYRADLSGALGALQVPVLLLWGDRDPISPVATGLRLQTLLPQARMHIVAGGEHDLAHQFAHHVAPLIDAHLRLRAMTSQVMP